MKRRHFTLGLVDYEGVSPLPVGACGAIPWTHYDITNRAADVTCRRCRKTLAYREATAKEPARD